MVTGTSDTGLYHTITPFEHADVERTHLYPADFGGSFEAPEFNLVSARTFEGKYSSPYNIVTRGEQVLLPEGILEVDEEAFYGCSALETIMIPASVMRIGVDAFKACENLTSIYFMGSKPDLELIDTPYNPRPPVFVPFFDISGLTVYYLKGASGWSPLDEWYVGAPLNEFTLAWNGYTTFHLTYVDTGDWLGLLDMLHSPWVFHLDSDRYVYVPESSADGNGGWVYLARP